MRALSRTEYIKRAKAVHGNRYNYDLVKEDYEFKITVICKIHGAFTQFRNHHLKGRGCAKCSRQKRTLTTAEFIERAKLVHGTRYSYRKTRYERCDLPLVITCREHGDFKQQPNNHLSGKGCDGCHKRSKWTTSGFIERARKVHGKRYDYANTVYTGAQDFLLIRCREHGEFKQRAFSHINGGGCPNCTPKNFSEVAIRWIEEEAKRRRLKNVRHAKNGGEYRVPGTRYFADGFHERTNTIFEFYGDAFHGNPKMYTKDETPHPFNKRRTASQLYRATQVRRHRLEKLGYTVVYIWERDYRLRHNR